MEKQTAYNAIHIIMQDLHGDDPTGYWDLLGRRIIDQLYDDYEIALEYKEEK